MIIEVVEMFGKIDFQKKKKKKKKKYAETSAIEANYSEWSTSQVVAKI